MLDVSMEEAAPTVPTPTPAGAGTAGTVQLASTNDFISPALACVKPVQIDKTKRNRILRLEGMQDEEAAVRPNKQTCPEFLLAKHSVCEIEQRSGFCKKRFFESPGGIKSILGFTEK